MTSRFDVYLRHYHNAEYGYIRNGTFVVPKHYAGIAVDVVVRNRVHDSGNGASFTREFSHRRAIPYTCTIVASDLSYSEAHKLERAMKDAKLSRYCPICNPGKWEKVILRLLGKLNIDIPY